MTNGYIPCRFGEHCRTRTSDGAGEAGPRGLCWPDETHGRFAIGQIADDYIQVVGRLAPTSGSGMGVVSTARAEAPVPVNLAADELMRAIVWDLLVWETAVRDAADLADVDEKRVRPYAAVLRGSQTLVAHYSTLLALRDVQHLPYVGEPASHGDVDHSIQADGCDGVARLVSLHHRAAGFLGLTRRRESRRLPCPAPIVPYAPTDDDGCGLCELGCDIGSDTVDCGWCGWTCTLDEYAIYATTLVAPRHDHYDPVLARLAVAA